MIAGKHHSVLSRLLLAGSLWVSVLGGPARAEDWHLQVEVLTEVPVHVGGRAMLEGPARLRLSTSLGVLPGAYVGLINAAVVGLGGYDQVTADLIEGSLTNSLVWRLHLGWRPVAESGFTFELGYGLVTLGGGLNAEDLVTLATGSEPPVSEPTQDRNYSVSSTLHMLDIEAGWQWDLWEGVVIRAAVGGAFTVGAATRIDPDYRPFLQRLVNTYTQAAGAYLNSVFTNYVFTPVITVAVGYRFF